MKKILVLLFLLLAIPFTRVTAVSSAEAGASARTVMAIAGVSQPDERVVRLRSFLTTHNSPLTGEAEFFVAEADRLGLDWKLVAAIAGVESTFGKRIPRNSYNGWGWGIFTGKSSGVVFTGWKDGIRTVSEGLKYRYLDRGAVTVEQIGRIYAASPTWASKVRFFMNKIDRHTVSLVTDLAMTI